MKYDSLAASSSSSSSSPSRTKVYHRHPTALLLTARAMPAPTAPNRHILSTGRVASMTRCQKLPILLLGAAEGCKASWDEPSATAAWRFSLLSACGNHINVPEGYFNEKTLIETAGEGPASKTDSACEEGSIARPRESGVGETSLPHWCDRPSCNSHSHKPCST